MAFQYQTLAQQVAQKIYLGELEDGQRLPSLRDFADQQKISLNTAKSCYELLEARGLVFVKAKSGYFIKAPKLQAARPECAGHKAPASRRCAVHPAVR